MPSGSWSTGSDISRKGVAVHLTSSNTKVSKEISRHQVSTIEVDKRNLETLNRGRECICCILSASRFLFLVCSPLLKALRIYSTEIGKLNVTGMYFSNRTITTSHPVDVRYKQNDTHLGDELAIVRPPYPKMNGRTLSFLQIEIQHYAPLLSYNWTRINLVHPGNYITSCDTINKNRGEVLVNALTVINIY